MQAQKIYSVLPNDITYFVQLPSDLPRIDLSSVKPGKGVQSITNALKYRFPMKYLGKQAAELTVLCIPAKEHQISESSKSQISESGKSQGHFPLFIKTNKETEIRGYRSGRRSAIIEQNGKLLRYKGCGNDGDGFVYQNSQLRGSHFFHTAKRQLFMTDLINKMLEKQTGETSANLPLFFYQFPQNIEHLGLRNDLRLLNKYCCVFETKGDRRVGTHLISPLQIIFLNAFEPIGFNLEQLFTEKERLDKFGLTQLLTDFQLVVQNGRSFLQKYDQGREFSNYVTLDEIEELGQLKQSKHFSQLLSKISAKFIKKERIDLSSLLPESYNWLPIVTIILEKLGWQMGLYKRLFCEYGINWGFFNDHNMWHCNAHLNNFIVRRPAPQSHFVLPLDFDLAFTRQEYINIDFESEHYGGRDLENFEQLLLAEYNAMEISVSGVELMNFSYSIDSEAQQEPSLLAKMKRVVFRDTLIRSFRKGMHRDLKEQDRINAKWRHHIEPIRKLVQSCLYISAQFQT